MRLEEEIKTESFTSPQLKAALNVLFTGYWLSDQYNVVFKQFDLSQAQYNVLRILRGQRGNAINLRDIQERMLQKNSNSTRIVEKLRIKGLVHRVLCEENRRKVEISITKEGLNFLSQIDTLMEVHEEDIFQNLSDEDAEALNHLLNKFRRRIDLSVNN